MRAPTGTVFRQRSGRWTVQITADGRRATVGTYDTEVEARAALAGAIDLRSQSAEPQALTLGTWGARWLEGRSDMPSAKTQGSVWAARIASTTLARKELRALVRRDVLTWLDAQTGAEQTRRNALNLLRACLGAAVERGHARHNAASDVKVSKQRRTHEPWTWLRLEELDALLECALPSERRVIAFAAGLGMRAGEVCYLERQDVRPDHVVVRYGGPGHKPTKGGKPRTLPLFGLAKDALREQLAALPPLPPGELTVKQRMQQRLVWPTARGCARNVNHMLGRHYVLGDSDACLDRVDVLGHQAGIFDDDAERPFHFHSLRHTCASLLVSGAWGRAWSLREVQELLGHASITTTERYAHLCGTLASRAAAEHDASR